MSWIDEYLEYREEPHRQTYRVYLSGSTMGREPPTAEAFYVRGAGYAEAWRLARRGVLFTDADCTKRIVVPLPIDPRLDVRSIWGGRRW